MIIKPVVTVFEKPLLSQLIGTSRTNIVGRIKNSHSLKFGVEKKLYISMRVIL